MKFSPIALVKALFRNEQPARAISPAQRRRTDSASSVVETLEPRTLLSVSATPKYVTSATFHDSDGDLVTVKITHGKGSGTNEALSLDGKTVKTSTASFYIVLDGASTDFADIESITVQGTSKAALSITVAPKKYPFPKGFVQYTNGITDIQTLMATPGTTTFGGVRSSGGSLDDVELGNVNITSLSLNPGRAPAIDQYNSGVINPESGFIQANAGKVDFGIINASAIGTLSITGLRSTNENGNGEGNGNGLGGGDFNGDENFDGIDGNDFVGPITVTNGIGKIVGANATLTSDATLIATSVGSINIFGIHNTINATTAGSIQGQDITDMNVTTTAPGGTTTVTIPNNAGTFNLNVAGNLKVINHDTGDFVVTAGGNIDFGSTVNFDGTVTAGGIISGLGAGTTDPIAITTGNAISSGSLIAGTAGLIPVGTNAITNVTFTGNGGFVGVIEADSGSIGVVTANHFGSGIFDENEIGATINSVQGAVGGVNANTALPNTDAMILLNVSAGTTIGPISAHDSAANGEAIIESVFTAGTGFSTITATSVRSTGIQDSQFLSGGDFGAIVATGGPNNEGIEDSTFTADGAFGTINATATGSGSVGVEDSNFRSNGDGFLGAITIKADTGIYNSTFTTAGSFTAPITITGTGGTAIASGDNDTTIFSAEGSLAGVTANGDINDSMFIAGLDIGADGFLGTGDDVLGTSDPLDAPTLGGVTVHGDVSDSVFVSGINPAGDGFNSRDNNQPTFGDDVVNNTGATLGSVSITGSIQFSTFESGTFGGVSPLSNLTGQVFNNNWVEAFTGNIGDIVRKGAFAGSAFDSNTIIADEGSIGNVLIQNTSAGGASAISYSVFKAGTSIGDVVGITAGAGSETFTPAGILSTKIVAGLVDPTGSIGTIEGIDTSSGTEFDPSGINSLFARAGTGGIGLSISAAATAFITSSGANLPAIAPATTNGVIGITGGDGYGITANSDDEDFFIAYDPTTVGTTGSIGNIIGVASNATLSEDGINNSIFQAGGSIQTVQAIAADSDSDAISSSTFNAQQNIGDITTTGSIIDAVFVAGNNLGASLLSNFDAGEGHGGEPSGSMGFGGGDDTAGTAPATIGNITLTSASNGVPAKITSSSFISGVTGTGPDLEFGGLDDATLAGSSIGNVVAPGGIDPTWFESGEIGTTTVSDGYISDTTYLMTNAAGNGIGDISVVDGVGGVGLADVDHNAIDDSSFVSAADIGNVTSTIQGINLSTFDRAISGTNFLADGAIGNITGTNNVTGVNGSFRDGLSDVEIEGAKSWGGVSDAAASIGNITGTISADDAAFGHAIRRTTAVATGDIGNISGLDSADGQNSQDGGIIHSTFHSTAGNIGTVTASTAGDEGLSGIFDGTFDAFGNIGAIDVTGNITDSTFTAGIDLGDNLAFGGGDDTGNPAATSIASITLHQVQAALDDGDLTGKIDGSTFKAGITGPGVDLTFGTVDDVTSAGSFIGPIVAPGGIDPSTFESGSIGTTTVAIVGTGFGGGIDGATYIATEAAGTGVGTISVVDNDLDNVPSAIEGLTIHSGATVADITGTTQGIFTNDDTHGIHNLTITAVGAVGNITGTDNSTGDKGDVRIGASNVSVTAGGAVGNISGVVSTTDNGDAQGLRNIQVVAASIGNITGTISGLADGTHGPSNSFDAGITNSTFRTTGGDIGNVTAATAGKIAANALRNVTLDAFGNIGNFIITGDITSLLAIAGIDVGADISTNGGGGGAAPSTGDGFTPHFAPNIDTGVNADHPNASASHIGSITLAAVGAGVGSGTGKINSSTFVAGLSNLGADDTFGGTGTTLGDANADLNVAGSSVGAITAPGGIDPVFVTAGSIGTTTVTNGKITGTTYVTTDAGGSIGDINATFAIPALATGNQFVIDNTNSFTSAGSIGDITADITGVRPAGVQVITIDGTTFTAGTDIGTIKATNETTGATGLFAEALTDVVATTGATGSIAGIDAEVTSADSTITSSWSIDDSTFQAGTGGIGAIKGTMANTDAGSEGIHGSLFHTTGAITSITASTAGVASNAISNDFFEAGGDIGPIIVGAGSVSGTKFGAGFVLASGVGKTWFTAGNSINANSTITSINVAGSFVSSTAIASVKSPTDNGVFGAATDISATTAGNDTGTIGSVTIGTGTFVAFGVAVYHTPNAIEAATLGTFKIAGTTIAPALDYTHTPTSIDNGAGDFITLDDLTA